MANYRNGSMIPMIRGVDYGTADDGIQFRNQGTITLFLSRDELWELLERKGAFSECEDQGV